MTVKHSAPIVNRSAPGGAIIPSLIYDDVEKAIDWLCTVFGFTERLRAGKQGKIAHAQLAIGQGGVMLGISRVGQGFASSPDTAELRQPRPNEVSQTLLVRVEDVDQHYKHVKERGARILQPPATHPFGERQYTAEDLAGYRWTFSQTVADVAPEEWGAKEAKIESPLELLPKPRLCYLEIPSSDLTKSVAFYEGVFGWNIRGRESDRPSFDDATGYVSGAWVKGREACWEPGLLPYIWVEGIDAVVAAAVAQGGTLVEEPRLDSPGGAWIARVRDPAGNVIGLYQEGPR